jgi:hypothetical protein
MRMDRYRADLTRINATWNEMDAAEMRQEAVANGEVQGNFGAPPPAPDTVVGSDDKSRLNAWCARFRDKAAGYNLAKQKQVLEKCYAQDCEQSLEGGNTNRPDRPGCRYVDGNGFCYAMGAGQIWCRDNAIRSCLGLRRCAGFAMRRCVLACRSFVRRHFAWPRVRISAATLLALPVYSLGVPSMPAPTNPTPAMPTQHTHHFLSCVT